MDKRAFFPSLFLPLMLLVPQLLITVVFFYWPALQAVLMSFQMEDAFGTTSEFVGFENYVAVFSDPFYYRSIGVTAVFSAAVAFLSLSLALLLAVKKSAKQALDDAVARGNQTLRQFERTANR